MWSPQAGPQKALVDCPVYEIFYGGARGGGKTDGVLGKMGLKALKYGAAFNCVFFRRELPMLDDAIERSKQIYGRLGGAWNDQKKTWLLPGGGRFRFRPLERVQDAEKYQGQNLTDVCIEEAGNYPDPSPVERLHGALRSAAGVPTQMHLTGNPGGAGQHWLRARYIEPAPMGMRVLKTELPGGLSRNRVYIPARVSDNRILLANDPGYIASLHLVGSAALVQAWLDGDWNVVAGAYFDCWSTPKLVVMPFEIPRGWLRFRSFDWGSAKPFSVGWWAVSDGGLLPDGRHFPTGAMVRYREWYGASAPNVGLKMDVEDVARGIAVREAGDEITYGVADPAIFAEEGGPSFAERMAKAAQISFRRGDNARVAQHGHIGGWDMLRSRMKGEDGRPMIYVFATCTDSIRTIPVLQHDPNRAEDLDTDGEDHAADEWRYACMSRPWARVPKKPPEPKWLHNATLDELWASNVGKDAGRGRERI